jgi:uncharacterized protein (DUF1330 family)
MPAYLVIRLSTDTPEKLKDYQLATPAIIAQYHGKFLARGGKVVTLEGPSETRRVVLIEFPSLAEAEAFYHSPEYTQARKLRDGNAVAEFIAVEGVA